LWDEFVRQPVARFSGRGRQRHRRGIWGFPEGKEQGAPEQEFPLPHSGKKGFLKGGRQAFLLFSSRMSTTEHMVLNVRMDREALHKFERILEWHDLYGDRRYTPDTCVADLIEKEYTRVA
jgi:hypothetical protein